LALAGTELEEALGRRRDIADYQEVSCPPVSGRQRPTSGSNHKLGGAESETGFRNQNGTGMGNKDGKRAATARGSPSPTTGGASTVKAGGQDGGGLSEAARMEERVVVRSLQSQERCEVSHLLTQSRVGDAISISFLFCNLFFTPSVT
jgi:hypothetical protein